MWAHLVAIGCNGQEILRAHLAAIGCNGLLQSLSHDGVGGAVKALQTNIRSCEQQNTELQECHEMVRHVVKHLEKQPESTHLLLSLVPRPPLQHCNRKGGSGE